MFSRIVGGYDRMNRIMTLGRDRGWRRLTVEAALPRPGGTALDLGAGTADLSLELVRQHDLSNVVALDLTPEMLVEGKWKVEAAGAASTIRFVVGDALALPFPSNTFDCIVTGFTIRNVADRPRALREMRRVLRSPGRAVILELTPLRTPVIRELFRFYFHRIVPWIGGLIAGDRAAYRYLPASVDTFPTVEELARELARAGFEGIRYRRLMFGTVAIHVAAVTK